MRASQNPDGGWGYKRGGMSYVEPTAAALLALSEQADAAEVRTRGLRFLSSLQHADGGWGIAALDETSGWMTGWAVLALQPSQDAAVARGTQWLLQSQGIRVTNPADVAQIHAILKIDPTLTGWPWQPGDAAWIFPTALALLALHAAGQAEHARAREGTSFLLDRAIPSGGWNIGNPFMVTGELPPTIINTALALVAFHQFGIENETIDKARNFLANAVAEARTAAELAWGAWALGTWKVDVAAALSRLKSFQRTDGSWNGNPLTTAVALMAGVEGTTR